MSEADHKPTHREKEIERIINSADNALTRGLENFNAWDYIGALKNFYESGKQAAIAALLAYGLDYQKEYGVGSFLSKNKKIFPKWFADEVDATAEVVNILENNRPKVVVFLVAQPMFYAYEHPIETYEAIAKRVHPKIQKTVQSCIRLAQQQLDKKG